MLEKLLRHFKPKEKENSFLFASSHIQGRERSGNKHFIEFSSRFFFYLPEGKVTEDKAETEKRLINYNKTTGKGLSTLEVVQGFEKATGVKVNWTYAPRREGDIEQVWGNVDKANKVLGWKAETPTDEVLKSAWKWQQKLREDGIQ